MDDEELAAAIREHRQYLLRIAFKMLWNWADAEDAFAQVCMNAWKGRAHYDGGSSVRTWLHAITKRAAIDILRKRRAQEEISAFEENEGAISSTKNALGDYFQASTPEDALHKQEFTQVFELCLRALGPRQQETLSLRAQGLSHKEIGAKIGISEGTVASHVYYGRRRLAELLDTYGYDLPSPREKS